MTLQALRSPCHRPIQTTLVAERVTGIGTGGKDVVISVVGNSEDTIVDILACFNGVFDKLVLASITTARAHETTSPPETVDAVYDSPPGILQTKPRLARINRLEEIVKETMRPMYLDASWAGHQTLSTGKLVLWSFQLEPSVRLATILAKGCKRSPV